MTIGRSDTLQVKCDCYSEEKNKCVSNSTNEAQSDITPEQRKTTGGNIDYQLQSLNEGEKHCKQVDSGETVVSVEPLVPLINQKPLRA